MSYRYRINKRSFKTKDGQTNVKYYACAKRFSKIPTSQLADDISARCSLTQGDILGSLSALSGVLYDYLSTGNSLKLDGIGTFSLSITSNPSDDPEKIDARSIKVGKVCFKADRKLSTKLKEIKFEKEPAPPKGAIIKTK
mgnify:CR=1 FL=1